MQKLGLEALQDIRIKHRWEAIDLGNKQIKEAKNNNKTYQPKFFVNGDTLEQMLVRNRCLLCKIKDHRTQKNNKESRYYLNIIHI